MILELKYPANLNQNLIFDKFHLPFRLSKNSKYVNGMNNYYLKVFKKYNLQKITRKVN